MADARQLVYRLALPFDSSSGSFNIFSPQTSTSKMEWVFQAPEAITITSLGFNVSSNTGTPPTYRISLQGIDASGNPDGTIKGGGSPASGTFQNPTAATFTWVTLSNSYTCTRGEMLAVVIDYSVGTIDASNRTTFSYQVGANSHLPYGIENSSGTRSRRAGVQLFGYKSSTKAYGNPVKNFPPTTFNLNTGTADEYGIKFTIPNEWLDTYQLLGGVVYLSPTAAGSFDLILYSGTTTSTANSTGAVTETTVQQQVSRDHDHFYSNSGFYYPACVMFDEVTLATLYGGATYRLMVRPTAAVDVTLSRVEVVTASDFDAMPLGQNVAQSTRLGASGNFTDDTLFRPRIDLIFADLAEPTGGGGMGLMQGLHPIELGICT